jgi:hypothetical protein
MFGTHDQKVSVTFRVELEAAGEAPDEQPAARAAAVSAQAAALAARANFIVHSCQGR